MDGMDAESRHASQVTACHAPADGIKACSMRYWTQDVHRSTSVAPSRVTVSSNVSAVNETGLFLHSSGSARQRGSEEVHIPTGVSDWSGS